MISDTAINDIEKMISDGLKPTPQDIIRLNALGLKVGRNSKSGDLYELPRVSYLGRNEVFREPTLAHLNWIDRVMDYVKRDDYGTFLAVNAYAISRSPDELPDALNRKACVSAISEYVKKNLADFTFAQIRAAVLYALHGNDHVAYEYPATDEKKDDVLRSVGVGVLLETVAMGLGCTVRDISNMTVSQARNLQRLGMRARGIDIAKSIDTTLQGEYEDTKYEIIERLKREKEVG